MKDHDQDSPLEIALVGDLTDHENELTDKLLQVPPGGECTLYFDSPGGSPYTALAQGQLPGGATAASFAVIRNGEQIGTSTVRVQRSWYRH